MALTEDMVRYIDATFAAEDRAAVTQLVSNATIHDCSPAGPRLKRCALVGSRGSMATLEYLVGLLRVDWRDVILAGEYESRNSKLTKVRDLTVPFEESYGET